MVNVKRKFDVNPQQLKLTVTLSAANTYTEKEYSVPVIQSMDNEMALVMEILRIRYFIPAPQIINVQTTVSYMHIADRSGIAIKGIADAGVVHADSRSRDCIDSAATDGTLVADGGFNGKSQDMHDGQGNGQLYGKQSIFIGGFSAQATVAITVSAVIDYRLKYVKASELIGIIQS